MLLSLITLSRLQSQADTIEVLLTGLNAWQIQNRIDEEKWSVHEHLAHLGRYQEIFFERMQLIRQGESPHFPRYSAETDVEFPAWQNSATVDILAQIPIQRREIYRLLTNFTEDELTYLGFHPTFGLLNVPAWVEFFLLHEAHHLFTIFRLASVAY
jgi:uncharacterized damage-inducible protein DinB